MVEFKIIRKNRYGHHFIEEPTERIEYRNKCKHQRLGCLCDKGYKCYMPDHRGIISSVLIGCTPNVNCPRLRRWDKQQGLTQPYTMVENTRHYE